MGEMDIETQVMIALHTVIRNVSEWATELLQDLIQKYVYDWGYNQKIAAMGQGQSTVYYMWNHFKPTGEFLRSITMDQVHTDIGNYVGFLIYSDGQKMTLDAKDNKHGVLKDGIARDYRNVLMEHLNEGFDDLPNHAKVRWWVDRPPFFDIYIRELDSKIWSIITNEMKKVGLDVVSANISGRSEDDSF